MSNYDINSNPALVKLMIENEKKANEQYLKENPDSLIPLFESELRELGYIFEVQSQIAGFLPKHKETILPIVIRYYQESTKKSEKTFFMGLFHYKGFEEVIPMLLEDFYSDSLLVDRWMIGDRLYQIRSEKHIDDYLKIISTPQYGKSRAMVILLVGKLKTEKAIPILVELLKDENVRSHAIIALSNYKREEFRPYFERFENDKNSYWRKYARAALKKLEK